MELHTGTFKRLPRHDKCSKHLSWDCSWWIYNRQNKTSEKQELTLNHIKELNERHDSILKRLEQSDMRHDSTLNAILELNKEMEHIIERQDKLHKSIQSKALSSKDDYAETGE